MDRKKLQFQFDYLAKIRKLRLRRLVELHNDTFEGTKYWIPTECFTREELVKRLWYYFAAKNYHEDGQLRKVFFERAKQYLTHNPLKERQIKETKLQELLEQGYLTEKRIYELQIQEVDTFLSILGLWTDVGPDRRRKILLAYIINPKSRRTVRKWLGRRPGLDNLYCLEDIMIKYPSMKYIEFRSKFGASMPTTTRESFDQQKYRLRKLGKIEKFIPKGKKSRRHDGL